MRLTFFSAADKIRPMFTRNERGFIFAEFAIGLPLIALMLWSMAHLFSSTWTTCRNLIADLTLQMEVRDAMLRIVDDMRTAQNISKDGGILIIRIATAEDISGNQQPIFYMRDQNPDGHFCIYRQRTKINDGNHPITGGDLLSKTNVIQFSVVEEKTRLWRVTIKARSEVSGHEFTLKTAVYAGGADR